MIEPILRGVINRALQLLARMAPGGATFRVALHRARGVRIGRNVSIGYDAVLETSDPWLITIEDGSTINARVTIIAHMRELTDGVRIERDAFIGPGAIILPNVTIGHGAVVTAGSVVTRSVLPMTVVQGNPAVPVATCGIPLTPATSMKEFSRQLKPFVRGHTTCEQSTRSMAAESASPTSIL